MKSDAPYESFLTHKYAAEPTLLIEKEDSDDEMCSKEGFWAMKSRFTAESFL